jgi:hypothetical protein
VDTVRDEPVTNQEHDWAGDGGRECQCEMCFGRRRQLYLAWRAGCAADIASVNSCVREVWTVEDILQREG